MVVIGLTGGMGCGKGYCSKIFLEHGIPSIDTDGVSRTVTAPGSECLKELTEAFGKDILKSDGSLDRKKLASIVFSDKKSLKTLNRITHRHILDYSYRWLDEKKEEGCKAAILDAPMLFESGADKKCDVVVSVVCDRKKRISRVMKRDGMTRGEAEKRMANQHTDRFFRSRSDYVIDNNDGEDIRGQISDIVNDIQKRQQKA